MGKQVIFYFLIVTSLVSSYMYTSPPVITLEETDFVNIPESEFPEFSDLIIAKNWLNNKKFVKKVFNKENHSF